MDPYNAAVSEAWTNLRSRPLLLPWELNPWLRRVLEPPKSSWFVPMPVFMMIPPQLPAFPCPTPPAEIRRDTVQRLGHKLVAAVGPAYVAAVRKLRDAPWEKTKEADRDRALAMWKLIVETRPEASVTGRQLLEELASGRKGTTLSDTFKKKKTSTLFKRAGSILRYVRWCGETVPPTIPLPPTETVTYQYVCHLRESKKAASVGADFRSALAFCLGTIGLDGVAECLSSARAQGAANELLGTKRILKQRDTLKVPMLGALEDGAGDFADMFDRVASGHFAFLSHGRSRMHDSQYIQSLRIDLDDKKQTGYVEAPTSCTKTSNTADKRHRFLPMAAPTHGVSSRTWAMDWIAAREATGLFCMPGKPFFPAPKLDGSGWQDRPLTAEEGTSWLRQLLIKKGFDASALLNIGVHSCKATPLSFCAKWDVEKSVRRMLGYHAERGDTSVMTYSRDNMAGPLRAYELVLHDIRRGVFFPDSTRSGMFKGSRAERLPSLEPPQKRSRFLEVHPSQSAADDEHAPLHPHAVDVNEMFLYCLMCGEDLPSSCDLLKCTGCMREGCAACTPMRRKADGNLLCRSCHCEAFSDVTFDHGAVSSSHGDGFGDAKSAEGDALSQFTTDSELSSASDVEDLREIAEATEEVARVLRPRRPGAQIERSDWVMYRHSLYKTLHWFNPEKEGNFHPSRSVDDMDDADDDEDVHSVVPRFECGRLVHANYVRLSDVPSFPFPKCSQCFWYET